MSSHTMKLPERLVVLGIVTIVSAVIFLVWTKNHKQPQHKFGTHFSVQDLEKRLYPDPMKSYDDINFKLVQDISALHTKFTYSTQDSCDNTCQTNDTDCNTKTHSQWENVYSKNDLKGIPLFQDNEYFFPWELPYLKTPPLTDFKTLPSLTLSKVYFIPKDKTARQSNWALGSEKTVLLTKNVQATFRVDLFDGYGHRRTIGGDEVRAWLKGKTDAPLPEVVWATAEVNDFGNGSYEVKAMPLWTGTVELNIAVTYPREYIRLAIHHLRIGFQRFIFGMFKRDNVKEVTLCHSTANIPGRHCLCNMTKINSLPFYCGRLLDTRLSCDDWRQTSSLIPSAMLDMTPAEKQMDNEMSRVPQKSVIRHFISIKVQERNKDISLPPCHKASLRTSWTMMSPQGVWSKNRTKWTSLACLEPPMTSQWIHSCLRSTSVWMVGESNIREMALKLAESIGCNTDQINQYPSESVCRNEEYDITIRFRPHEYPLYISENWVDVLQNGAVQDTISSIPSTGEHILIIHYYLHFMSSHLNVFLQRLQSLKSAISTLLSRNPKVLVVIRGPHITAVEWEKSHMFLGDVLGTFARQITLDTFRGLQDRILFLDGWDMSISLENLKFHPNEHFIQAMWRTILAYKCDKEK